MNFVNEDIVTLNRISITNLLPEIGPDEVVNEIVAGLWSRPKQISSKYFYNKKGSILFEEITRLKEYYPTRTEKAILEGIAPDLMHRYADYEIVELGPGDHSKISILLRPRISCHFFSPMTLVIKSSELCARSFRTCMITIVASYRLATLAA